MTEFSFLGELTSLTSLVCVSCLFINNFDCLSVAILGFIEYLIFDSCGRLFKRHQLNCKLNNFCTCRFWSTSNPVKTRSHVDECKWQKNVASFSLLIRSQLLFKCFVIFIFTCHSHES